MQHEQPRGLSRRNVERLLLAATCDVPICSRIEHFSRQLIGRPYKQNPLIGSAHSAEVFTASLDGFDCVTYVETVLALARASTVDDFVGWLRKIRYKRGRVKWERRNHYMTDWIRNNFRQGVIRPVSAPRVPQIVRERILNVVPGLAARRTRVRCVPKRGAARLSPNFENGDLIFFASTSKNLDVFHAGIIVRDGKRILIRHASRSRGRVLEQGLSTFLKSNRMAGIIVVRPRDGTERHAKR
jgi:hypothetical protein